MKIFDFEVSGTLEKIDHKDPFFRITVMSSTPDEAKQTAVTDLTNAGFNVVEVTKVEKMRLI